MKKRMLALLLALVMLLLPVLASCGKDDAPKDDGKEDVGENGVGNTDNNTENENGGDTDGDDDGPGYEIGLGVGGSNYLHPTVGSGGTLYGYYFEPVEELDYKGEVFNILVPKSNGPIASRDFATEYSENKADVIQDAAYYRVLQVNKLYNTDIRAITANTSVVSQAQNDIEGRLCTYDLILCDLSEIGALATRHLLCDLTLFDEEQIIQLDAPWYNQSFVRNMSVGDRLYYAVGGFSLMDNEGVNVMQVNADLLDESALGDPFAAVFDGTWTIDVMYEMVKGRARDLDESEALDQYDQFGFVADFADINDFMIAGEVLAVGKDNSDEDVPKYVMDTSRASAMLDKVLALFGDATTTANVASFTKDADVPDVYAYCDKMFFENRVLMRCVPLYRIAQSPPTETKYMILPMPKYDAEQEHYLHLYENDVPAVAIPAYVKADRTVEGNAAVMEALSVYGKGALNKHYYYVLYQGLDALGNSDARKVLDIIFDDCYMDVAALNNFGGINGVYDSSAASGENRFSSEYGSVEPSLKRALKDYIALWTEDAENK